MIRARSSASPNFFALFEGDDPSKLTTHIAKQQIKPIYFAPYCLTECSKKLHLILRTF
jgi:hypothetical protein